MARSRLKRYLAAVQADLSSYPISIQDADGRFLLGNDDKGTRYPIVYESQIYGWVISEADAQPLANLASALVAKELEVQQLADETLSLYREINLVYNLSENLADTLELDTVSELVLGEAQRLISATRGAVLFLDSDSDSLTVMKHFGEPLDWKTLFDAVARSGKSDIVYDFSSDPRFSQIAPVLSLLYAPLKTKRSLLGAVILTSDTRVQYTANDLKLLVTLSTLAASAMDNVLLHEQTMQEEKVRANLLRQFSPKIAENLVSSQKPFELGGSHVMPITLLMSDIRGFTVKSASMESDEVVRFLNDMFSRLVPIIFKYDGTIDKFIGDAILAVFGSPEPDGNQWEKSISAAIEMQQAMHEMQDIWQIGIGIHTGEAVHGFIGSLERMEYTVIGDAVNKTARYCDGAKGGEIIVSDSLYQKVATQFDFSGQPTIIKTKHADTEGNLVGYRVKLLESNR